MQNVSNIDIPSAQSLAEWIKNNRTLKWLLTFEQRELAWCLYNKIITISHWNDNLSIIRDELHWLIETLQSFLTIKFDDVFGELLKKIDIKKDIESQIDTQTPQWKELLNIVQNFREKWYDVWFWMLSWEVFLIIDVPQLGDSDFTFEDK